jgi:hypothetical protein
MRGMLNIASPPYKSQGHNMSKTFSATFLDQKKHDYTKAYAKEYKSLTLSAFALFAMNEYIKAHAWKGHDEETYGIEGKDRSGVQQPSNKSDGLHFV